MADAAQAMQQAEASSKGLSNSPLQGEPADGARLQNTEDAANLEKAIMALPEGQREVPVLKVFEQLTFREIAEVMSISENTAASRYRYALKKQAHGYGLTSCVLLITLRWHFRLRLAHFLHHRLDVFFVNEWR